MLWVGTVAAGDTCVQSAYPMVSKGSDETRVAADGRVVDATLKFTTTANTDYWVLGVLVFQQPIDTGLPGCAVAANHTGDTSAYASAEGQANTAIATTATAVNINPRPRALSNFDTYYAASTWTGTTTVKFHHIDSVVRVGATGGTWAVKWGLGDLAAAGSTTMLADSWIWKVPLTSADGWGVVHKTSDETRYTSTATADSDLTFGLDESSVYLIRGTLWVQAGATPSIRVGVGATGGTIARAAGLVQAQTPLYAVGGNASGSNSGEAGALAPSNTAPITTRTMTGVGDATTYVDYWTHYEFTLLLDVTTASTFEVKWAQSTTNATIPAALLQGSTVVYRKITSDCTVSYVIKQANENRTTNLPIADDAELAITLQANKKYWIESVVVSYVRATYAGTQQFALSFDGDCEELEGETHHGYIWPTSSFESNRSLFNIVRTPSWLGTTVNTSNSAGDNTSYRGAIRFRMYFRTGANGGTLRVRWRGTAGISTTSTVFAGSFIVAHDIETGNP